MSKKLPTAFVAKNKICASKSKLEFWKLVSTTVSLLTSQYLMDFLMSGDFNKYIFVKLYKKICQCLEYLFKKINNFHMTNAQYHKIKNSCKIWDLVM
jgi:hypothetical protein